MEKIHDIRINYLFTLKKPLKMTKENLIYESPGHLLNGIEVYSHGVVIQGSERAAYENGGSSFDEKNRRVVHLVEGCKHRFNTTPSYNSLAEFSGVQVIMENGVIQVDTHEDLLNEAAVNAQETLDAG